MSSCKLRAKYRQRDSVNRTKL